MMPIKDHPTPEETARINKAPRPPGLHHTPPTTSTEARAILDKVAEREVNMPPRSSSRVPHTPPATSTEARAILDEQQKRIEEKARDIVEGARQSEYGGPEDSFARIARLWNAHLQNRGLDAHLSPGDVALMMDLMKTARLISAPGHLDSIVDKIGYTIAYAKAVEADP